MLREFGTDEGEGGGCPISDQRKGGCVDLVLTKGRDGVQNPENLADVICVCPLTTPIALKTLQVCCVDMFIKKGS